MRRSSVLTVAAILTLVAATPSAAQQDEPGSKDHRLFSRWPGYYIDSYEEKAFDARELSVGEHEEETVEGRVFIINYYARDETSAASELQIIRNFENAAKQAAGTVVYSDPPHFTTLRFVNDGKEVWASVRPWNDGSGIELVIVERAAMKQIIQASAEAWMDELTATGHAAVYGITFDTDKADIKPASEPILAEVARLLKENPNLRVFVVGHTDATGSFEHNMVLSEARAAAVVRVLAAGHGITATRLQAAGVGPVAPVASNRTEEGRAKNRRVELVER